MTKHLKTHPSTLIVGPSWVGDMVMAQSLFKTLKRQNPDVQIDVLAPNWSRALLARMPEVRRSIDMPLGHGELKLAERKALGKSLRDTPYQQAIVLPNSFKSALVPFWANIPVRTGYVGEFRYFILNDARKLDKSLLTRTVDRFVALGLPKGAPHPPHVPHPRLEVAASQVEQSLARFNLSKTSTPILALCPGAEYGRAKRWPTLYFAALARHYLAHEWEVWLFGSDKDRSVTDEVNQLTTHQCIDLSGQTQLGEAVDLLSQANAVVTNDSGLMHVAAALDRPLAAVFGSSDPNFTPPLSIDASIVSHYLHCSPCFQRECPHQHINCLSELYPQEVIEALDALLARKKSP